MSASVMPAPTPWKRCAASTLAMLPWCLIAIPTNSVAACVSAPCSLWPPSCIPRFSLLTSLPQVWTSPSRRKFLTNCAPKRSNAAPPAAPLHLWIAPRRAARKPSAPLQHPHSGQPSRPAQAQGRVPLPDAVQQGPRRMPSGAYAPVGRGLAGPLPRLLQPHSP